MIERQHLRIVLETERLGSMTAAADVLNLTQSALSHTMRKFEERQNVRIWEKEGRGLRLTEAGQYMLALAQRILPQIDHAERVLRDFGKGQRGTLRVGMECHPCQQWLMRVVTPYLQAWPMVDLDVKTAFRGSGIDALREHEIDLLITPDPIELSDLEFRRIFEYELVLAVPADHPLGHEARPGDLTDQILITYPVPPERLDIFTRFLLPAQLRPAQHRSVESTQMMLQLVAAGRGISAVPDWILHEHGADLPIRAVRLAGGMPMALHIGLRRGEGRIDYITGLIDLACRQAH